MAVKLVNRQLNEKFEYILEGADDAECIKRTKEVIQIDPTFVPLMKLAADKDNGITGLPEGIPSTLKIEKDVPAGIAPTTIRQEFRRISNFVANGSVQKLKPFKRETVWVQLLEGLHWREVEVLTMIKDQTLFVHYPKLAPIFTQLKLNITVPVGEKKKDKEAASKSKKGVDSVD